MATASRADLVPVRVVEGSLRGSYVAVSMALGRAFLALMPLVMIMFLCTALL